MNRLSIVFTLLFSFSSQAYVPKLQTIIQKLVGNRSENSSLVENEVKFQIENEKLLVKERWIIKDSDNYLLEASGPNFKYYSLFLEGKRYRFSADSQQILMSELTPKQFEAMFFSNDPNFVSRYLVSLGLVSDKILKPVEPAFTLEEINNVREENLRLTRVDGEITYGIGLVAPENSKILPNQVWVVQDSFQVKKIRGPNFVVEARNYKNLRKDFSVATQRKIKTPEYTVEITTNKITPINVGPKTKKKFELSYISSNPPMFPSTENAIYKHLKEFYLSFR